MSASFNVAASSGNYPVRVECGLLESLLVADGSQIVIADDWFSSVVSSKAKPFIALNATEASKSLDAIPEMIIRLRQMGANRQTRLVALGGGVVQDVAAFIASVFMRGIEWTYIPTTLLAMADSCIGGKSSINVGPF
jgi:3-dehydroquinate synthase